VLFFIEHDTAACTWPASPPTPQVTG
jgi:hypothetical protein